MAVSVSPYINFQGRAREAMAFYQSALGGTVELYAMGQQGKLKPAGSQDRVQFAQLKSGDVRISATDGHPNFPPTVGDNMAVALGGSDASALTKLFDALGAGGQVKGPLKAEPGSAGYLLDKFGINWIVTVEGR